MAQIFDRLARNKQAIIDAVVTVLQSVPDEHDYAQDLRRIEEELSAIQAKKDRLLEMSIEGVISMAEFKQRNDGFNEQIKTLEEKLAVIQLESEKGKQTTAQLGEIRTALEQELSFKNGINSALVTTILDKIVVKKGSTKEELHLDIHLKFGGPWGVVFNRKNSSFRFNPCLQCAPPDADYVPPGYFWPPGLPGRTAPDTPSPPRLSAAGGTLPLLRTGAG